jgi:hypothetical protein
MIDDQLRKLHNSFLEELIKLIANKAEYLKVVNKKEIFQV